MPKISLLLEDGLAALVFVFVLGCGLYPVLSLEPEKNLRGHAQRPLPERCVFPEKVDCGRQQWIAQGCEPFESPAVTCVNADLRKATK